MVYRSDSVHYRREREGLAPLGPIQEQASYFLQQILYLIEKGTQKNVFYWSNHPAICRYLLISVLYYTRSYNRILRIKSQNKKTKHTYVKCNVAH